MKVASLVFALTLALATTKYSMSHYRGQTAPSAEFIGRGPGLLPLFG